MIARPDTAVEDEREACAVLVDALRSCEQGTNFLAVAIRCTAREIAREIRARGEK